jgi:hypothetical protein
MFDVEAVRSGIKTTIEANVVGLRVYTWASASISTPAIVVTTGDPFLSYHVANAKGLVEARFDLTILVGRASEIRSQELLDEYLSAGTGASKSIIDALESDRTLGGSVSDCIVTEASAYFTTDAGEASLAGATLTLAAYAPRK